MADVEIIPDIYDVEPNNTYEKGTLPKRMRYYHGLIDTQLLAFLYTKGTEGNPSQKLADMLKYIEKTTDKNVVNQDIASIQQLVGQVKRKKEVNISYMKSWEIEKTIRKEGYNDGFSEGYEGGYEGGRQNGQDRVNLLIMKLSKAGRMADLVRAAGDKEYQETLFEEFGL